MKRNVFWTTRLSMRRSRWTAAKARGRGNPAEEAVSVERSREAGHGGAGDNLGLFAFLRRGHGRVRRRFVGRFGATETRPKKALRPSRGLSTSTGTLPEEIATPSS